MNIEQRIYRTVTSLSYDVVDSTVLMQQIGAEQYAVLIEQIHHHYAQIVLEFGGISDLPQGDDGLMCYFGALASDEYAKESALLAALAMQQLAKQNKWNIRIGMAYGQVAVYKQQPIGATVHLAARIQKITGNQQILVSADLAEQTSKRFIFQLVSDSLTFKGFDSHPVVFELIEQKTGQNITSKSERKVKDYLYGRQGVLKDLRSIWRKVQTMSSGNSLHIVGEAGIGKSTLIHNFVAAAKPPKSNLFFWSCFQEQQQAAYQPVKNALISTIGLSSSEPQDVWLEKIEKSISSARLNVEQKSIVYLLLDLPAPNDLVGLVAVEDVAVYEKKILQTLIAWFRFESHDLPLLLVVEDVHWADPATMRLLALLQEAVPSLPGLLITTQRPRKDVENSPFFLAHDNQVLELSRLNYEDSSALVGALCKERALDAQDVDWIVERTGGIPLFIQECVRLIQHSDLKNDGPPYRQIRSTWLPQAAVAKSIGSETQEILMQRIDALGEQRIFAQIASALGSEFRLEVLIRISNSFEINTAKIDMFEVINTLVQENILNLGVTDTQQSYSFSHALLREVAYQSMWESDRKKLHLVILDIYQQHFADLVRTQPSQMARHWSAAGKYQQAATCLLDAAQQARAKGAHQVSIECCEAALELLQSLPNTEAMQLQSSLMAAGQILATHGYGADGAGKHFRYAQQLSHQLNNVKTLDKAQLGLCAYYLTRAEFSDAEHHIQTGSHRPSALLDPLSQLQWHLAQAMLHFYRGEIVASSELMAQCAQEASGVPKSNQLIQNPLVIAQVYQGFCLWTMGKTETACDVAQKGLLLAEAQPLRLAKIQAYGVWSMILYCRGEWQLAQNAAHVSMTSGQSGEYELWLNVAQFISGAAKVRLAMQGDANQAQIKQGLAQMHSADQKWASKSAIATRSFYLCLLAQCHLDLEQYATCQSYLKQAQDLIQKHGERYFSTEVQRTYAALLMADRTQTNWADLAKTELNQAFDDAYGRELYSFAQRIATTMCEWEQLANKQCKWSSRALSAQSLLTECNDNIEKVNP